MQAFTWRRMEQWGSRGKESWNRYEGSKGRSDKQVQSETGLMGRVGTVKMILTKINDRFSRLPNKGCIAWFKSLQQHLEIWGKISLKIKIQWWSGTITLYHCYLSNRLLHVWKQIHPNLLDSAGRRTSALWNLPPVLSTMTALKAST